MLSWLKNLFHRPETSRREKWISGIASFAYIFLMGFSGGRMSAVTMAWYDKLIKPDATPPGWIFPIAWTILFALIGLACYYVWNYYESDLARKIFAGLYVINGFLVFLWSYMFFWRQMPAGGLYVIIALIIVIEMMIITAFRTNCKAAYLLLPYFLWILFATYLNTTIIMLNP